MGKKLKYDERMIVHVPKKTRKRYCWKTDRILLLDMRCIRSENRANRQYPVRRNFANPEQLEFLCNEYFESCNGVIFNNKTGMPYIKLDGSVLIGQVKPYTISGLALFLGISSTNLRDYEFGILDELGIPDEDEYENVQYSQVIRRARQKIEAYAEQRLYDKDGFGGGKFVLDCAFNWVGKKETAEIKQMQDTILQRREEFELKKEMLTGKDSEDSEINITIVRKRKDEET